jgi:glyoxylase-like metal-dependent hydrolase (beta-lactamase superfamily II)
VSAGAGAGSSSAGGAPERSPEDSAQATEAPGDGGWSFSTALEKAAAEGIHCLPIPTPFAVGRINCYLVEDEPLTLVDAGPNSATSLTVLEAALAEHGRRIEDLQRIVVTHQHIDHIGLVDILAKRSGAQVCALAVLAPWLADYKRQMIANDRFGAAVMLRNGIPEDVVNALRAVSAGFRAWGAAAQVDHPLEDGSLLEFASRSWRVLHRPGHSPSDTLFYDERSQVLLGGDHLIGHISSNPLISLPLEALAREGGDEEAALVRLAGSRPRALTAYLDSLRRTREMEVETVLAGHGDPVESHRELIDKRFAMHERRARRLRALISERPRNAYELAQQMWGDVAVTQAYLTLSEVLGHVDLLIAEGSVREQMREEVVYFEAGRSSTARL